VARYHNIFGPEGTWQGGREKAPAALCRKVAEATDGGSIDIWGDGEQTRSFLYVDECVEGTTRLIRSDLTGPYNIGSEEMVTINKLAEMYINLSGKNLSIKHIPGPLGVRGRNSDNCLFREKIGWEPTQPLEKGLKMTFQWISDQIHGATGATGEAYTPDTPGDWEVIAPRTITEALDRLAARVRDLTAMGLGGPVE